MEQNSPAAFATADPAFEASRRPRLDVIDIARGIALLAMAVYHFSWDLFWFRLVDWDVAQGAGWKAFAVAIASSFLALSGVSLVLAHGKIIRWRAFGRRFLVIAVAATAVTVGTWYVFGNTFVRFGILHCIALSSVLALPFLRLPPVATLAAAAFLGTLPLWLSAEIFDHPALVWTGLGVYPPPAVDYVPLLPWSAAVLTGVAAARVALDHGLVERLTVLRARRRPARLAALAGRHSLAVYLLHQPILYGLVVGAVALGLTPERAEIEFSDNCRLTCSVTATDAVCARACDCTLDTLKAEGIWSKLLANPSDSPLTEHMRETYAECRRAAE